METGSVLRPTLLFIAFVIGLLAAPATGSAKTLSFGVHTPSDPFGGSTHEIDALQRDIRRHIDVVSWFQNWGGEPWVSQVQPHVFNAVFNRGRRPLVTCEPWAPGGGASQPRFSLQRIAGGDFDDYIERWARGLKALRSTIYLRPMHEMNGNWYPWGGTVNGNSPTLFKQAWARMHVIFDRQGADNVKWVFSPVTEDWPMNPDNRFERYYPGRRFVDVLALDGYNWGSRKPQFGGWRSFRTTFARPYRRLARLGRQPIWIAEVGSATEGGNKAAWVRDMFRTAAKMRRLRTIVWMDTVDDDEGDWRMRSPVDVTSAFWPNTLRASAASVRSLRVARRSRAGRRIVLRWTPMGAGGEVARWRVYLNGRRIRTLGATRARVFRTRIRRPGRYRWTVRGFDAAGDGVVSASAQTRVVGRRR
jgi:hypothetical protein